MKEKKKLYDLTVTTSIERDISLVRRSYSSEEEEANEQESSQAEET